MQKETVALHNIKQDLERVVKLSVLKKTEWRQSYYVPITALAILTGVFLKNVWIGLLIFSFAAYHIVLHIRESREYRVVKKEILGALERADISVSVEELDHIATEHIYEPHFAFGGGASRRHYKIARFFYFKSGRAWRIPGVANHYKWSREYYVSNEGLMNISLQGDKFYFVSLQGHDDIAYIYPCKTFNLDERIGKNV